MKKQVIATCVALGLGVMSGAAFAAVTTFTGNEQVTGTNAGVCPLLSRDITLGVSSRVHGGFECDEAENLIKVAACHEGGSRTGVLCQAIPVLDDTGTATGEVTFAAGCDQTLADAGAQSPIPSYKAFFTSSAGGVMTEQALDGRCSDSTLPGIDGFQ
ncbi:hypothetical protein [Pseudomonas sp. BMS12]|uniref:hypothetical protein n=1 Tax=Pseudomonas sp. BMS12 TaxID=1796033 RepID=UPI00129066E2|nr:hypothetical protein [Pseudomonas sp. BMS12]